MFHNNCLHITLVLVECGEIQSHMNANTYNIVFYIDTQIFQKLTSTT